MRLALGARDRDLIGRPVHQLGAGKLLDQVRIVPAHQGDPVLQALAIGLHLGQLLLTDAKLGLGVFQLQDAAIAPDGVGAEITHHRKGDRRQDQSQEKAGDRTLDSHAPNESQTDSPGQGKFGKGFKELNADVLKLCEKILYTEAMRRLTAVFLFAMAFLAGGAIFLATRPTPVLHALVLELQGPGLFERCRQAGACAKLELLPQPQPPPRKIAPADMDRS